MYHKERIKKNGAIVYDFICSGLEPVSRKSKAYQRTRELPPELIGKKKAIGKFLSQCQIEIQNEIDQMEPLLSKKTILNLPTSQQNGLRIS